MFLVHLERGIGELLRIVKVWTKQLKVLFCIYFGIGLDCTLGMSLSLFDFVDWLGFPIGCWCLFFEYFPLMVFVALYTPCILFYYNFHLPIKKKKKKKKKKRMRMK